MFRSRSHNESKKATGLCITTHQFRHAAAGIFLKHSPGEYERSGAC